MPIQHNWWSWRFWEVPTTVTISIGASFFMDLYLDAPSESYISASPPPLILTMDFKRPLTPMWHVTVLHMQWYSDWKSILCKQHSCPVVFHWLSIGVCWTVVHFTVCTSIALSMQQGDTALYYASEKGHTDIVSILLCSGSDIQAVNQVGHLNIITFHTHATLYCTNTSTWYRPRPTTGQMYCRKCFLFNIALNLTQLY